MQMESSLEWPNEWLLYSETLRRGLELVIEPDLMVTNLAVDTVKIHDSSFLVFLTLKYIQGIYLRHDLGNAAAGHISEQRPHKHG